MGTQYISTTDAAKLIREALKTSFPCVKFSVRSSLYAIRIYWTDGPTDAQVNSILKTLDEVVSDTVFTNRKHSDQLISQAIQRVKTRGRLNEEITPEDYHNGVAGRIFVQYLFESADRLILGEAKKISLSSMPV